MFLLVFSLALLVPPPAWPDSPSIVSSRVVDVLVQGRGAATAVAAVGGKSLTALPIVDGLLARIPAGEAPDLARQPGVRAVTDAARPLQVKAADPADGAAAGAVDNPAPAPDESATLPVGAPPPEGEAAASLSSGAGAASLSSGAGAASLSSSEGSAGLGVGVGVLDTGISSNGDLAGRVVAGADLSGE